MNTRDHTAKDRIFRAGQPRKAATWSFSLFLLIAVSAAVIPGVVSQAQAQDGDVGQRGPSFGEPDTLQPTRDKPQSKVWFNDGAWWASMFEPGVGEYTIHRYDESSDSWSDTGTTIDERPGSRADTLWDGEHLYIATAGQRPLQGADSGRILRYSYDEESGEYTLDEGFPVTVMTGGMEAIVLDKDSEGRLWVTYTQLQRQTEPDTPESQVFVNHSSLDDESEWGEPFVLPVDGADVTRDDISALVSYDLNTEAPQIGVMWSNQNEDAIYFASHRDNDGEFEWKATETAIRGPNAADDHINLKSMHSDATGRIFAAFKTEMDKADPPDSNAPQVYLSVLKHDGEFENHVFARVRDQHTRPNVLIDDENRELYLLATAPTGGGAIYYKKSPLSDISFEDGRGTPLIQSSEDPRVNDVTTSKQTINSETGLMALAADDTTGFYLYNNLPIEESNDNTPPDTSIDSGPEGTVNTNSATFEFSSSEDGSSFECSLDGAAFDFEGCASPKEYENLSDGEHDFEVRATDDAGNTDPDPASRTWTVDTQAPDVTEVQPQDGAGNVAADSTITATFSKNMDADTVNEDTFTLNKAGDSEPVQATVTYENENREATLEPGEDLERGASYTAAIEGGENGVKDSAGNALAEDERWSFETEPPPVPQTSIDSGPEGTVGPGSVEFTFSSDQQDATFECRLDGGAFEECASPKEYEDLEGGEHTFEVRAVGSAGQRDDSPASRNFTVDPSAPTIESLSPEPDSFVGTRTPTIEATVTDEQQDLTKDDITLRVSGKEVTDFDYSQETDRLSYETRRLPAGERDARITARDGAGNTQSRHWSFTVDPGKPVIRQITPEPDSFVGTRTPTIEAIVRDGRQDLDKGNIRLRVAGQEVTDFKYNKDTDRLSHETRSLPAGKRGARIIVRDDAGNARSEHWVFTIDPGKPVITSLNPRPNSSVNTRTPVIRALVRDGRQDLDKGNVRLRVAGQEVTDFKYNKDTDRLSHETRSLPAGKRGARIIVRDDAGNLRIRHWFFRVE